MSISAKIIADSISPTGHRFTSFEITCHRWILAEINTHRALSRNYRSSRAVPVAKLIQEVENNPAMPVAWLKNKPGMVASEPMGTIDERRARDLWIYASRCASYAAAGQLDSGLHKQWINRILEPYLYVHGVISGTDWNNFFALRRAPDAQPEFKVLADLMYEALEESTPRQLNPGEWHLPYCSKQDLMSLTELYPEGTDSWPILRKISTARVARVSIKPFDSDKADVAADLLLHDRLLAQRHMSPFEHQATPDIHGPHSSSKLWEHPKQHGNLTGWVQYRKTIPNESVPG